MGASGSWDGAADPATLDPNTLAQMLGLGMDPKVARARVMQSSLRQRAVTTPVASRPTVAPVAPEPAAPLPAGPDWNTQRARLEAKLEELNQPKDLSALKAEGARRGAEGQSGLLMALAAQQAGPDFQGIQQHMLKRAMAAQEPLKFSGGIVNPQGDVIEDPNYKAQEQLQTYERRMGNVDRGQSAEAMAAAARQQRMDALALQQQGANERASERNALMLQLKGMGIDAAAQKAAAEKPAKPMPAGMQKAWMENRNNLAAVDRAIAATQAYPGAFGPSNMIGDFAKQYTDPKGVAARAAVADIGSLKIHDRSGAAVTAMEFPRLRPFIPNMTDKPEVVKTKLDNFKATYNDIQNEIASFASDQGYRAPAVPDRPAAPAGAAPKTMSWGELK
jgi:hypothetical protein